MKYNGPKVTDLPSPKAIAWPVSMIWLCLVMAIMVFAFAGVQRYPVGQPVPSEVYTAPFDPCDPAYKFFQTKYGDPNNPKYQAAPDEWIAKFGNNERTMLLHAISELRVVVAAQAKRLAVLEEFAKKAEQQSSVVILKEIEQRLLALEDWQKKQPVWKWDGELYSIYPCGYEPNTGKPKDPNEAKPDQSDLSDRSDTSDRSEK